MREENPETSFAAQPCSRESSTRSRTAARDSLALASAAAASALVLALAFAPAASALALASGAASFSESRSSPREGDKQGDRRRPRRRRRGKQSPSESAQKELADELRAKVVYEFIKRRGDTEWFLEGDFESYVSHMRKPHVWGGEPELLMCSHVLRMPITVHMYTKGSDNPRIIAEYGQEYGKDDPVRVLYDGYGHYDALQSPLGRAQSRLRGV